MSANPHATPWFTWNTPSALVILVAGIPAITVAITADARTALAALLGLLPTVLIGVPPKRRARLRVIALGVMIALALVTGALIKSIDHAWLAAAVMAALGFGASWAATKSMLGAVALAIIVPVTGIGLSYDKPSDILPIAGLLIIGSTLSGLISLLVPNENAHPAAPLPRMTPPVARRYGTLLALALAIGTLAGFALDHTGWIVGTIGLVMRPPVMVQVWRSWWRIASVLTGALVACAMALATQNAVILTSAGVVILAAGAGLHASRAYVMPTFATFVVFMQLLYPTTFDDARHWLVERVTWVSTGVVIAAVIGIGVPWVLRKYRAHRHRAATGGTPGGTPGTHKAHHT